MKRRRVIPACALLLAASAPLFAQSSQLDERPVTFHIAGGYSGTVGHTSDYLRGGWIVSGGATWHPRAGSPFYLRLDGHYSEYDATRRLIAIGTEATQTRIDDGRGRTFGLDLNGILDVPFGQAARGYVTAGVGLDRRRVELTRVSLFNGVFCDPWWGLCGVGTVAGDRLVASDTTTRFSWNAGLGMELALARETVFIEARYHRIETKRPTEFVPIQVGIRF